MAPQFMRSLQLPNLGVILIPLSLSLSVTDPSASQVLLFLQNIPAICLQCHNPRGHACLSLDLAATAQLAPLPSWSLSRSPQQQLGIFENPEISFIALLKTV